MDRRRCLRALTTRVPAIALVAVAAPFVASGRGTADADPALSLRLRYSRVFVANHGKLVGAFGGFAWVAGAEGVRIDAPSPCNERACFRGADGVLCARGALPARSCSGQPPAGSRTVEESGPHRERGLPCDPWAIKIGLDVRREGGPWGSVAKPYVSIEHRGATRSRLAAHRSGDPPDREYCIEDYPSGELVGADHFHAECWREGGEALAAFDSVDKFILELPASDEATAFDYCITAIHVAEPGDAETERSETTKQ
jgi:hypothetical protein